MNWSVYNDSLVSRGGIFLDFSALEDWNKEIRGMSDGRRGKAFHIPKLLN